MQTVNKEERHSKKPLVMSVFGLFVVIIVATALTGYRQARRHALNEVLNQITAADKKTIYNAQQKLWFIDQGLLAEELPRLRKHYVSQLRTGNDTWTKLNAIKMLVWLQSETELAAAMESPDAEIRAWTAMFGSEMPSETIATALMRLIDDTVEVNLQHPTPIGMGRKPQKRSRLVEMLPLFGKPSAVVPGSGPQSFLSGKTGYGKQSISQIAANSLMKLLGIRTGAFGIDAREAQASWEKYGNLRITREQRLQNMLEDSDELVVLDAASNLLCPEGIEAYELAKHLGADSPAVERDAVPNKIDPHAVSKLRELLHSKRKPGIRDIPAEAAKCLAAIGIGDGRDIMHKRLSSNAKWILPALTRVADESSVPFLIAALHDPANKRVVESGGGGTRTISGVTTNIAPYTITIKDKISKLLVDLTGQDFGTDEGAWKEWYKKETVEGSPGDKALDMALRSEHIAATAGQDTKKSDVAKKKGAPKAALVIVVDSSKMQDGMTLGRNVCKQAIKELGRKDEIGVLRCNQSASTDNNFYGVNWLFPLTQAGEYPRLAKVIDDAEFGGMPRFEPIVQKGLTALLQSEAAAKHMIILSSGGPHAPSPNLVAQFQTAQIPVSTITVWPHDAACVSRMQSIASETGGRHYYPKDPAQLPSIIIKEISSY
jgi:hypothetical protein